MHVSVVTPTYNASIYIEACIENVAAQGEIISEHIIVDGGSTDETLDIVQRLMKKYPHVSLLKGPDKGQSDALNKGTAAATAPIIGVLNCDDTYQPKAAERAVAILKELPEPAFVTGNCLIAFESGKKKMTRPKDLRLESLLLGPDLVPFPYNPASYFYSKSLHVLVGGYDISDHYAMDYDFILKCAAITELHYIDEHWGNFYMHSGCKTFNNSDPTPQLELIIARYQHLLTPKQLRSQSRIRTINSLKVMARKMRNRLAIAIKR